MTKQKKNIPVNESINENAINDDLIPNEKPFIPNSSIPPMPSQKNPIHVRYNSRLKKMYIKEDHICVSDSDFSDTDSDIEFPFNTHGKSNENGLLNNIIGKKKTLTFIMPRKDAKALRRTKLYAKRLDKGVSFGKIKIPIDPLLGFIPVIGDFAGIIAGSGTVALASKVGLPKKILGKMMANLALDAIVGLTPALGDIADFFYKSNWKNYIILEKYLVKRSKDLTRMINGEMEPERFYMKYKSFVKTHKKDIYFIHENLGIPLPKKMEINTTPEPQDPEDPNQDIANTEGLIFVTDDKKKTGNNKNSSSQGTSSNTIEVVEIKPSESDETILPPPPYSPPHKQSNL